MSFIRQACLVFASLGFCIEDSSGQCLYPPCRAPPPPRAVEFPTTTGVKTGAAAKTTEGKTDEPSVHGMDPRRHSGHNSVTTTPSLASSETPRTGSRHPRVERSTPGYLTATTQRNSTAARMGGRPLVGPYGVAGIILICLLAAGGVIWFVRNRGTGSRFNGSLLRRMGFRLPLRRVRFDDHLHEDLEVDLAVSAAPAAGACALAAEEVTEHHVFKLD